MDYTAEKTKDSQTLSIGKQFLFGGAERRQSGRRELHCKPFVAIQHNKEGKSYTLSAHEALATLYTHSAFKFPQ